MYHSNNIYTDISTRYVITDIHVLLQQYIHRCINKVCVNRYITPAIYMPRYQQGMCKQIYHSNNTYTDLSTRYVLTYISLQQYIHRDINQVCVNRYITPAIYTPRYQPGMCKEIFHSSNIYTEISTRYVLTVIYLLS